MNQLILVSVLAIIDKQNKVLITKRPIDKPFGNFWEFPGGKLKKNETPEHAIVREIKEELDINIEKNCIAPLSFSTTNFNKNSYIIMLYVCRKLEKNLKIKENVEFKWVHPFNLNKYNMPKANSYLCSALCDLIT